MASTNFLQFNPGLDNTETDAAYLADTLRSGGITTGAIFPSPLANKIFYQASAFYAAFAQMMVNKGYTVNDSPYSTLVSVLNNVKTSADFPTSIVTLTFSASIAFNAVQTSQWWLTLTGNVTSSSISGQVSGQTLLFIFTQDGTGGHTFVWPSAITGGGTISGTANSTSIQLFSVLPNGDIYPITRMVWISASGIIAQSGVGVVSVSATGNVSNTYAEILENASAASGAITRTLYKCSLNPVGFKVNIAKIDSSTNPVTIAAFSGDTIDQAANIQIFPQYNSFSFISDGVSNWTIV